MKFNFSLRFLYVYVFVTGASVMAIEIAASRFLAPYFGTSTFVWANIIGLILLSLSIGYWIGGKWAERWPSGKFLMSLSLLSGVFMCLIPLWGKFIFPLLSNGILATPVQIIICSFFAMSIVFAPPIFLLAMVGPFSIRLLSDKTNDVGRVAGNLYACSTLGSLFGTFGTALITIPFIGAKETIFIWSSILILISVWGFFCTFNNWLTGLVVLPFIVYSITHTQASHIGKDKVLFAKDTFYQFVRVTENQTGDISLIYNEGGGVQSIKKVRHELHDEYYSDYLYLPYLINKPEKVLILGLAAGTIPRLLSTYVKLDFPDLKITGVELDPEVVKLGCRYFGLRPEDAKIVIQDARTYIRNTDEKYDVIILDCFSNQIYIPGHLATWEFFATVREHLTKDGLIALNIGATSSNAKLLKSFIRTVGHVFPYTYCLKTNGQYNHMIIGAMEPIDRTNLNRINKGHPLAQIEKKLNQAVLIKNDQRDEGYLFSDNHAPTELLTDFMIWSKIRS